MSQYYRSPGNSDKTTRKANGSLQENMLMAGRIGELLEEVCSNLSKVKIEETVMLWLARNRLDRNEATSQNTLIEAFAFAAQLLLFTPSMTGIRLIDRFIRDRRPKCRPSDLVALHALEQSRFTY